MFFVLHKDTFFCFASQSLKKNVETPYIMTSLQNSHFQYFCIAGRGTPRPYALLFLHQFLNHAFQLVYLLLLVVYLGLLALNYLLLLFHGLNKDWAKG